jgi:hypothetical protein
VQGGSGVESFIRAVAAASSLAAWALACSPPIAELELPGDQSTRAILLAALPVDGEPILNAIDPQSTRAFTATWPAHTQLIAVLLARPWGDLGLSPGPIALASGPDARPVGPVHAAFASQPEPGLSAPWTAIDPTRPPVSDLRLPPFADGQRCIERGGCELPPDGVCQLPCPAASSAPADPAAPEPPSAPPDAPRFVCPAGWRTVALGVSALAGCEPWPEGGAPSCAPGMAAWPGGEGASAGASPAGCAPIGTPCSGSYAPDLPAGVPTLYIDPSAAPGGDGSRAHPYGAIALATAVAPAGSVLALAPGTYRESVQLDRGVTLWGACPSGSRLEAPPGAQAALIVVRTATGASVRNLTLAGPGKGIINYATGVVLGGLVFDATGQAALYVGYGGAATADRVSIARPAAEGVYVETGGTLSLSRAAVRGCLRSGLRVSDPGSRLDLDSVAVSGTTPGAEGLGYGMAVLSGAEARLSSFVSEDNTEFGLTVFAATATLTDVVLRRTLGRGSVYGYGLHLGDHATADIARARIEANHTNGIYAQDGVRVHLADAYVAGTLPREDAGNHGFGVSIDSGARLRAERLRVEANRYTGLALANAATATLADVSIAGTLVEEISGLYGEGLGLYSGAQATVARLSSSDQAAAAVRVQDPGTALMLADATLAGSANGLVVSGGASADLERALVAGSAAAGVGLDGAGTLFTGRDLEVRSSSSAAGLDLAPGVRASVLGAALLMSAPGGVHARGPATSLALVDVRITATRAVGGQNLDGVGLRLSSGATLSAARLAIADSAGAGVVVEDAGSAGVLSDLHVERSAGAGLSGAAGGRLVVSGFLVADDQGPGIAIDGSGSVELHQGRVLRHAVGARIRGAPGFDTDLLSDRVAFIDDATTLDLGP